MEENKMSDFLSFDINTPCEIRIKLTNAAVNSARDLNCGPNWFKYCSGLNRVMITLGSKGDMYFLHLGGNVISCRVTNEDNDRNNIYFLATGVSKENYRNKNEALQSGLCFYSENGFIISYYNQNNAFHYKNGSSFIPGFVNKNCSNAIHFVMASFEAKKKDTVTQEIQEYQPSQELMEYLNLAKQYSEAEYALEEQRALSNEPLHYDRIEGCDYARIANCAYRFFVNEFDDKIYTLNTKVEVTDINDEKLRATIIESGTDENGTPFVDLLFNEQVSLEKIQSIGSITLSFSSVNKDVQQKAIEKIIDGSSDAKYMNDILGNAEPKGFDTPDMTALDEELKSYKYPPNQSQMDGIFKGISTKDIYMVMGPPGTGKTTVILEWIKYFVKEKNMRVLVSSQNNKAVDNVLERIINQDGIDALRIGSENKVTESVKPCLFELKLSNLREKIKNATDGNSDKILSHKSYWTNIYELISPMEQHYQSKAELEQQLNRACMMLNTSYAAIDDSLTQYNSLESSITFDVQKTNELIDKEMNYLSKNVFVRFILKIGSLIRNYRIRKGVERYDINKSKLVYIASQYAQQCESFLQFYDNTVTNVYAPEREMADVIGQKMESFAIDYDENTDPWNVFDLSSYKNTDITSSVFYYGITSGIQNSLAKADAIAQELKKWQKVSVDTSNYTLKSILLEGVNLVGATCIGINSQHRFSDLKFDVSIIDEAGQIQIHNALVPMSVSNKIIMLGDHKQIPPMADQEVTDILEEHQISTELMEKSLFEDLYNRIPDTNKSMLDTQYRMPGEIADIISEWFYEGNYKSFEGKRNMESILPILSNKPLLIIDTSNSGDKRYERSIVQGEQTVHDNPLEASVASDIVALLNKKGYDLDNVGIIAALKAQVDLIRKQLKDKGLSPESTNEIAATLDSYQGQERDIIIYSFGRSSNKEPSKNGVGFLTELRRLNVAMSRCKKSLIMIGDMKFLSERESVTDYKGNVIIDHEKTEKNFSQFIRHMLSKVENGSGEIIDVATFNERMENWKNQG